MRTIPFVKKEQADLAREMEQKILQLPRSSGVLFVGVEVAPTEVGEDPVYSVTVGMDRSSGLHKVAEHLVYKTLSAEILEGANVQVEVRRGAIRA